MSQRGCNRVGKAIKKPRKVLKIDPGDFLSWLNTAREGRVVAGCPESPRACPLANFLMDCEIAEEIYVTGSYVWLAKDFYGEAEKYYVPRWMIRFQKQADKEKGLISFSRARRIFKESQRGCSNER